MSVVTQRSLTFIMTFCIVGLLFFVFVSKGLSVLSVDLNGNVNNRPIIGILSQEVSYNLNKIYPNQFKSYIAASYVKYVEGAGARVVPIWIGKNESYYEHILSQINGVLFPGGATYFNRSNGYADAGEIIYRVAKRMNEEGDYFPLFGICLGFELLTYLEAQRVEHRTNCFSNAKSLPLKFTSDFRKSRLFSHAATDIIQILENKNVTINFHRYCVTRDDLEKVNISKYFRVISLNSDEKGLEFISSLEHNTFPFYGTQFHPEKNLYEWVQNQNIPHSFSAIKVSQYFANFFVNEARKNKHMFMNNTEEQESLIYNYCPKYTAIKESSFMQCYLFDN